MTALLEQLRRRWCRAFGHVGVLEQRGEPVVLFHVCTRCGRFWR